MDIRQRIVVAAEHQECATLIETALSADDHRVVAKCHPTGDVEMTLRRARPDALIIEMTEPRPPMLTQWGRLLRAQSLPVVVFAERDHLGCIRTAVEVGISAYIVDGLKRQRVLPILEAAVARFHQFKTLREQRDEAIERLTERRDIERAKGILMRRRDLAEQAAYDVLRKMAVERGARVIDVAESILSAEALLLRNY